MKLDINGQLYEYDGDQLTLREAFEMKERTGWGLRDFGQAYYDREPAAYCWIAYVCLKRAGEQVDWDTLDLDLSALIDSIDKANKEPQDPTPPADQETASG